MPNRLYHSTTPEELRVLLLPPTSRDSVALREVLTKENIHHDFCAGMESLVEAIGVGVGVVIVSEEALLADASALVERVESQPVWSDLPIIVLSRSGSESPVLGQILELLGNASVLERPVRMSTLVSVIRSAIRARHKQYQVREDLAERSRNAESLRRGSEQMEMVVNGAEVGIWYCPLPFDKLIWDDKVKEHFHLKPDAEITFDSFMTGIHPQDRERTRLAIDASIANRVPYEIDYRTVSGDRSEVKWIRAIGRAYYDPSGSPTRFDGITIDVTNRVRAEMELRAGEERLQLAVQTGKLGVWELDLSQEIMTCSNTCKANYGRHPDQPFSYQDLQTAVHPDDRERMRSVVADAVAARSGFEMEYRVVWPTGETHWILVRGQSDRARDDAPDRLIGVTLDITDRKAVEERRAALLSAERAARNAAEHAGRMKDEFLATLSHELRTPLSAILGWAQILKLQGKLSPEIQEGVDVIERNAHAQARIIDDLLDMNRIISGKIRLELKPIAVAEILRAAIETVQPAADAKEIRISVDFADLIGPLQLDPNRMQQVFWNLLSNSVKFTPKNGNVSVSLRRVHSHLEVHVEDDGEGIDAAFLPNVFDRFRQADARTTRKYGGLGLGLAIVKQLVELHGGTIAAESAGVGCGSRFIVALPIGPIAQVQTPTGDVLLNPIAASSPISSVELERLAGLKVLIVDDEPDARHMIGRLLENHRAHSVLAGSVEEAMSLLQRELPDVVVSDIGMPGEDGFSLIHRLRKLPPRSGGDVPAIALTAYARDEDRRKILDAGFQTYLTKPVNSNELIAAILEHYI